MRPSLHPRLVNDPFGDPGLLIPFMFEKRALLFDLGDLSRLTPRDLLKVSHIFVTHTHMDHFAGFDTLLRLHLGREKPLYLYGPQGFLRNVEGKLAGYSWNLVDNYRNLFTLFVTEISTDVQLSQTYVCHQKFIPTHQARRAPFEGVLLDEPSFNVCGVTLDHGLPCIGFCLKQRFHINIKKDALAALGLQTGPWLNRFKLALYAQDDPESQFEVKDGSGKTRASFGLQDLADRIALITPGQKISYITDVVYSRANIEKIIALIQDSDHLFIEAAFLDRHKEIARQKCHLTARQAGSLAAQAHVKRVTPFHFSPRYTGQGERLYQETMDAFQAGLLSNRKRP
jgi:ribonuclease Z